MSNNSPQTPGFQAWIIWATASVFFFYQYILLLSYGILASEIEATFGIGAAAFGVLSALFSITYGIFQLPGGILLDRMSVRRLLTAGCALTTAGVFVFGISPNVYVAAVGSCLMGAGVCVAFVGATYICSQWFPPGRFALMAGLTVLVGCLGGAIMQQIFAALLDFYGWRTIMGGLAVFGVLTTALLWLIVRDRAEQPVPTSSQAKEDGSGGLGQALGSVLGNPQIWLAALYIGLILGQCISFGSVWNIPFQLAFYKGLAKAALVNSSLFVGLGFGCAAIGAISDRLQRRVRPMQVGAIVAFFAMGGLIWTPPLPDVAVVTLLFVLGFACGASNLSYILSVENTPPRFSATALGFIATMAFVIGGLFQILPGLMLAANTSNGGGGSDHVQYGIEEYGSAFIVFPLASVLALIITFFIRETYCRSREDT